MTTKYDLGRRLVEEHVIQNVNELVAALGQSSGNEIEEYREELYNLAGSYDFEEAAYQFIMHDADRADLERIVDQYAWWDETLAKIGYDQEALDKAYAELDKLGDAASHAWIDNEDPALEDDLKRAQYELAEQLDALPTDLDAWVDANPAKMQELREAVQHVIDQESGANEWVCSEFNLEPDFQETFEFWLVTDYLARLLKDKGAVVEEVLGLTVWGRGCSGQAICMDAITQDIAFEIWGSEVTETCPADAF